MHVIFVKWGSKYSSSHVNDLYNSLCKYNSDIQYYCLTDNADGIDTNINIIQLDPKLHLKGVWVKLFMFSETFPLTGNIMYFDLDTVIQDNPFNVIVDWTKLTVVNCHWKPKEIIRVNNYDVTINSSMLAWNAGNKDIHNIWTKFNSSLRDYYLRKYVGIDRFLVHEGFDFMFSYFPEDYIMSYKYEKQKASPVITFEEVNFERADFIPFTQAN